MSKPTACEKCGQQEWHEFKSTTHKVLLIYVCKHCLSMVFQEEKSNG